jgi:hypothetical protein
MEKRLTSEVSLDDMPRAVYEPYALLLDGTGVAPTVERSGYGRMLLTHLGQRTRMTIQFRLNGRKWHWGQSHLFIDGKPAPLAQGADAYIAIYRDPDNGRQNHIPEGAEKFDPPKTESVDRRDLPASVTREIRGLWGFAENAGSITVRAEITVERDRYLVSVEPVAGGPKIVYVFTPKGPDWLLAEVGLVNAAGYDVGRFLNDGETEGFLREALGVTDRDIPLPQLPLVRKLNPEGTQVNTKMSHDHRFIFRNH